MNRSWNVRVRDRVVLRRAGTGALFALLSIAACETDAPTAVQVQVRSAALAKGGGSGGSSGATTVSVTSTLPTSATQDTTVDVTIYGSGFASGATAVWSLNGDTSRVHVRSTKYVSSSQLTARIIVPVDAPIASYDVVVTLVGGKKGVGAELFAVTLADPRAEFLLPITDSQISLTGDGLYVDGLNSVYAYGVCGVNAKIFATTQYSNTGDAIMDTSNPKFSDRRCAAYPRTITIRYSDGQAEAAPVFMNVRQVANTTFSIPVGTVVKRGFAVQTPRCGQLLWASARQGVPVPADSVLVERVAVDTWHVYSQAAPNDRASCANDGQIYHMPVDFVVRSSRPLP